MTSMDRFCYWASNVLLAAAFVGCTAHSPAVGVGSGDFLGQKNALLTCNSEATGGEALQSVQMLTYQLEIEEPTFKARGIYRVRRTGAVRIDVFMQSERVMSEGWDEQGGWLLPQGSDAPTEASPEGEANLRHGFELPGHLWTLEDVERRGHKVTYVGMESRGKASYHVFEVELADGHRGWYLLNPDTCLVERSRDFRSFHPDMGTETSWIETIYEDFREVSGVVKPHVRRNIDYATGDTLSVTLVKDIEVHRQVHSEDPFRP